MPIDEKDVYNQLSENYRYFLSWRQKILAGYFAILAALALGFSWVFKSMPLEAFIVPFAAAFMTWILKMLDKRNRDAYQDVIKAGGELESKINLTKEDGGAYIKLQSNYDRTDMTHSKVIDIMFNSLFVGFIIIGFYIFVRFTYPVLSICSNK